MITKSELQNAHRDVLDEERARIGEPPSAEVLLAYSRGELSHEEEERIAGILACYPELARALAEPFPAEEAKPGEAGYVSDAELAERWTMIQNHLDSRQRFTQSSGRVLQFSRILGGIAAAVALALGAMLWQARSALGEPRITEQQILTSDRTRGAEIETPPTLSATAQANVIVIPATMDQPFAHYRLRIVDESKRTLWKSGLLAEPSNDTFAITVPHGFLEPGRYQVVLFGVGDTEQQLETYSMRVPR